VGEMKCLWSIIAAIYHLGTAGVSMGRYLIHRFPFKDYPIIRHSKTLKFRCLASAAV
jgi:hypothetical protein